MRNVEIALFITGHVIVASLKFGFKLFQLMLEVVYTSSRLSIQVFLRIMFNYFLFCNWLFESFYWIEYFFWLADLSCIILLEIAYGINKYLIVAYSMEVVRVIDKRSSKSTDRNSFQFSPLIVSRSLLS